MADNLGEYFMDALSLKNTQPSDSQMSGLLPCLRCGTEDPEEIIVFGYYYKCRKCGRASETFPLARTWSKARADWQTISER